MLKVVLMRHAASQLEQYGKNDRDRTISMAGMHEIDALRPQLSGVLDKISLVVCSNVKRTRQTLEGIRPFFSPNAVLQYEDAIYQASADVLWHKIQTLPSSHQQAMIIGHNPGLTNVLHTINANGVSHPNLFDVFPTCGIVVLETGVQKWHEVSAYNLTISKVIIAN